MIHGERYGASKYQEGCYTTYRPSPSLHYSLSLSSVADDKIPLMINETPMNIDETRKNLMELTANFLLFTRSLATAHGQTQ